MKALIRYDIMADFTDVREFEPYAPQPLSTEGQCREGVMWSLYERAEAVAMRDRILAARPESEARVYELSTTHEETGNEEWKPAADGLTLVLSAD